MAKSRRTLKGAQGYYELLATLANGALSRYHLAVTHTDGDQRRYVVVRESLPEVLKDPTLAQAFLQELRALARFEHPNLVRAIEAAATKTSYFAIMEYLAGEGLGLVVQTAAQSDRPLEPGLAVAWMVQVCDGLDHAHRATNAKGEPLGVVHSAITPPRIVLGYDGRARLIGFDLHRSSARRQDTSATASVAYSSPEQCNGEPPNPRSDIFSLGVILWELLATRPLFLRVSHSGTMQAILASAVPSMGAADRGVSPELEAIVRRALQSDPAARFQTAAELGAALRGWQTAAGHAPGEPELATWIRKLFAERIPRKRLLLEQALQGELSEAEAHLLAPDQENISAWPQTGNRSAKPDDQKPAAPSSLPPKPQEPPARPTPAPVSGEPVASAARRTRGRTALVASLVVVGLLGAAVGLAKMLGLGPFAPAADPGAQPDAGLVEPAPDAKATLVIRSEPSGCQVLLAGTALAEPTPASALQIEPGSSQLVAVRCPGHLEQTLQVTAEPGERITLAFHPDPLPPMGKLSLTSQPNTEVYLGTERLGSTPLENLALPAGEHELRLIHSDSGASLVVRVKILPERTTRLFKRLVSRKKAG